MSFVSHLRSEHDYLYAFIITLLCHRGLQSISRSVLCPQRYHFIFFNRSCDFDCKSWARLSCRACLIIFVRKSLKMTRKSSYCKRICIRTRLLRRGVF
jgi:hypothetical protein